MRIGLGVTGKDDDRDERSGKLVEGVRKKDTRMTTMTSGERVKKRKEYEAKSC
jgi:hypothetical protein